MNLGRPLAPLQLQREQREQLQAMASSRSLPHGLVTRVRIILLSADGLSNKDIAARLRLNQVTVGLWRRRFVKQGLTGLHEELRSGRPRSIPDEKVATFIRRTLRTKPKDGTHWSCRSLATETRLSKSTIHRIWRAFGLQPHRARHFQLSNDPFFVEKVRDIVGLYLNPPDKALVLCVDEKNQIPALERSQPMLPLGLGYVARHHPQLRPSRHHHIVCGLRPDHRNGPESVQTPSSSPGVPRFSAACRRQCAQGF